jgi:hypothetical protein
MSAEDEAGPDVYGDVTALKVAARVLIVLIIAAAAVVVATLATIGRAGRTAESTLVAPAATLELAAVFDDFEGVDGEQLGTPVKGSAWVFYGNGWVVEGGESLVAIPDDGQPSLAVTPSGVSDGLVQVRLASVESGAGLVFRFRDLGNYWQLAASPESGTYVLTKVVDGVASVVGSTGLIGVENGTTIGVVLDGSRIRIVVDGIERAAFADPALRDADVVGMISTSEPSARFDDFVSSAR